MFFAMVSDTVSEGFLAKLYTKHFGNYPDPIWVRVNTFSPRSPRVSPHYIYHGMFSVEHATELFLEKYYCTEDYERLLLAYTLWGAKASGHDYSPLTDLYEYYEDSPPSYPLTEEQFPEDSYLLNSYELARIKESITPRAYGLDRFPELMQKLPPPY